MAQSVHEDLGLCWNLGLPRNPWSPRAQPLRPGSPQPSTTRVTQTQAALFTLGFPDPGLGPPPTVAMMPWNALSP